MNKDNVLVIAVHPDDETLGCGGTILKHKSQGDRVHWLLITGPNEGNALQYDEIGTALSSIIKKVANAYSFDSVHILGLPEIKLQQIDLSVIISKVAKVISDVRPSVVYMMFAHDVHSDHRVAFDAVYSCTKSFRYPFIERIYMMETLSETEFAPAIAAKTFNPNVYVDITDYMDKKLEIMRMYDTEVMEEPYPRSLSSIKALAKLRGSRAGVMFAEAFQLLYERR